MTNNPEWPEPAEFLKEAELAARWRLTPRTLQRWRQQGRAIDHALIGGKILYRVEDVEAHERRASRRGDRAQRPGGAE